MKNFYGVVAILLGSVLATGCSSVSEDEIQDASAGETADAPVTEAASTDAVPEEVAAPPAEQAVAEATPPAEAVAEVPAAPVEEVPAAPAEQPIADAIVAEPVAVADTAPVAPAEPAIEAPVITEPVVSEPAPSEPVAANGTTYKVKQGDTLMKIAFENYGDLYRWREIYEANRAQIQDPNAVPPGTKLTLNGSGMVQIERNGEQYLIKNGDTLGSISNDVYGTKRKWKVLWENNRQMIKDPNKIYAGFYLYYKPMGRMTETGSESKEATSM